MLCVCNSSSPKVSTSNTKGTPKKTPEKSPGPQGDSGGESSEAAATPTGSTRKRGHPEVNATTSRKTLAL